MLKERYSHTNEAPEFVERFVKDNSVPKYLYGRNLYAREILKLIKIDGIIRDSYDAETWSGKKVVNLEDVPQNSYRFY